MKVGDASTNAWESIIASVRQETVRAQSDLRGYHAAVEAGDRRADMEAERVLEQAVRDRQTTERILKELYKRQYPDPPPA
jgi:hypothetical protein